MQFPNWDKNWKIIKYFWKKFSIIEKILIYSLVFFILADLLFYDVLFNKSSSFKPQKGGVLVEGMVGEPSFINPVYASSEVDKALSSLVFSGLVEYNKQKELVPLLAERWEVSPEKRDYKFFLRKDIRWHDGVAFGADDIEYTLAVLQNPDYNGAYKSVWSGVSLEKIDQNTIIFHLPKPYPLFLESLTLGIMPRHLWIDIPVADFMKSSLNLNAIGTGPFRIEKIAKNKEGGISSIKLVSNENFAGGAPYINTFETRFYKDKESLVKGFDMREFSSFGLYSSDDPIAGKPTRGFSDFKIELPQYIGVFFNTGKEGALREKTIRQAMSYVIDKKKVNEVASYGLGKVIDSPILPHFLGYNEDIKKYDYDQKAANTVLSQAGWSDQNNDGAKEKDALELRFDLVTPDEPQFVRIANLIGEEWSKIGVKINIKKADSSVLEKDFIANRNYDILLIGENIGNDPDPYSYWHSTQSIAPGLNFSAYSSGEVDKLLEEARQTTDVNTRVKNYKKFQEIIAEDVPAIFLYQPVYVYKVYDKVKGVDFTGVINTWDRFYNMNEWFVKYKR